MTGTLADPTSDPTSGVTVPVTGVRIFRSLGRTLLGPPRWVAWILPVLWASLIFLLSSFQPDLSKIGISVFGGFLTNLGHPAAFGLLALFCVPVLRRSPGPGGRRWTSMSSIAGLWLVVLVSLYGFTDELHQSTVPGRDASLLDLLADFTGALSVVMIVRYLGRDDATDAGLRRRFLAGLLASVTAAGLSTLWDTMVGESPWPF